MIGDDNKLWYPGYKANTHIPWSDNNHHSQHIKMGDEECSGFRSLSNLLY